MELMDGLMYITWTAAWTVLAHYMAKRRGRNTSLAIVGGLMFGVFCPIYYLFAGDSKELRKQKILDEIARDNVVKSA